MRAHAHQTFACAVNISERSTQTVWQLHCAIHTTAPRTCVAVIEDEMDSIGRVGGINTSVKPTRKYTTLHQARRDYITHNCVGLDGDRRTIAMKAHSGELKARIPTP
jgi:hypothetical protein